MLDDTLGMDEDEELDDDVQAEVDKILGELTDGKLKQAPKLPEGSVRLPEPEVGSLTVAEEEEEEEEKEESEGEMEDMQTRLQALRS